MNFFHSFARRQAGMSLVELMVGMLIGLIGIVIITHLYVTNEEYKRRTTASGSAQSNGAIALYAIERDLRMAGFGLNDQRAFTCRCDQIANPGCSHIQYYYNGTYSFPPNGSAIGARNSLALYPVVITNTVSNDEPDTLSIFYGSDNERILGSNLASTMSNTTADIKLDGTQGFEAPNLPLNETGNLIVLQNGALCALFHVTGKTADALKHSSTGSLWNPPGAGLLPAPWDTNTALFNLGSKPNWRGYSIFKNADGSNSGRLQLTDQFKVLTQGAVSEDIMDGIFDLQAQYGIDSNGDGVVDQWTKCVIWPAPCPPAAGSGMPNDTHWSKVIAIRVAVLARSEAYVKPATDGAACDATTAANRPTWGGADALPFYALDKAGVLPSCYKYRAFETVVPLRNMLWRP